MPEVDVYRDVMIPMRDGIRLATDVYLPADRTGPVPCLLIRSPYGKSEGVPPLLDEGFAVAIQDKRGRYGSEGEYRVLGGDGVGTHRDGFDTVEWLAAQSWCSGDVGAVGLSYSGHTALSAAKAAPPHLRAGFVMQAATDEFTDLSFVDGVFNTRRGWWASIPFVADDLIAKLPEDLRVQARAELAEFTEAGLEVYRRTPLLDVPYVRHIHGVWRDTLLHREDPEYFAESRVGPAEAAMITVPVIHLGGWFDIFARNTVRHFALVSEHGGSAHARKNQRLVMGPWAHGPTTDVLAGVHYPDGGIDFVDVVVEWMRWWILDEPPPWSRYRVLIYVLGANRWRAESAWPLEAARPTPVYLARDGALTFGEPEGEGADTYRYDSRAPYEGLPVTSGMLDLSPYQTGDNVLSYVSAPLTEELEITGSPEAILHASSSATDTDWLVELHVVDETGTPRIVTEGIARARYRVSRTAPQSIVPGQVAEYRVELRPISVILSPGARLKVVISSGKSPITGDAPAYERHPNAFIDLNTAVESDFVVAVNTIHHGPAHPTRLVLPVVATDDRGVWIDNPWPPADATEETDAPPREYPASDLPD